MLAFLACFAAAANFATGRLVLALKSLVGALPVAGVFSFTVAATLDLEAHEW